MASRGAGLRPRSARDRLLGGGPEQKRKLEGNFIQRAVRPHYESLVSHSRSSEGEEGVRMRLLRAGFPFGMGAKDFIFLKKALAVGLPILAICLQGLVSVALFKVPFVLGWIILPIGALFVGYIGPDFWLVRLVGGRRHQMARTLPDVIDLISVSVEAGLGLVAAFQEVASRFHGPLGDELMRAIAEMRVGKTFAQALRDLSARLQIEDLTQFTASIIQAELLGISVGQALKTQAGIMREKRKQRAEEAAQKAPVKMMIPLILLILPTLFIVIMGPAALMAMKALQDTPLF